jgi:hypothetical protein
MSIKLVMDRFWVVFKLLNCAFTLITPHLLLLKYEMRTIFLYKINQITIDKILKLKFNNSGDETISIMTLGIIDIIITNAECR